MRLPVIFLLGLISIAAPLAAQTPDPADAIPQGIEALRQYAASKTEFSLDHSMLVLASKLDSQNEDLIRVIAGVSGISVHRYNFLEPWTYDPETVHSVSNQYHSTGWMQLMNKHPKDGTPSASDLWVRFQNEAISNVAILLARPN